MRTILAVGLGLIVGLVFKGHHTYVAAVGTIYAHVVSAVVIPLLIFSIISSITNLGNSVRLKNIGLKTVFFLVLNTFFASLITLIAGVVTNVGHGVKYELATDYTAKEVPTFVDTVISLFPQNLASHWANGEVVPIVVFCILVAISYNKIAAKKPEEVAPFKKFIDAGDVVMGRVVSYVISFTPYAVLSLIARCGQPLFSGRPRPSAECSGTGLCPLRDSGLRGRGRTHQDRRQAGPCPVLQGRLARRHCRFHFSEQCWHHPCHGQPADQEAGRQRGHRRLWRKSGCKPRYAGCAGVWPTLLAVFTIHLLGIDYTPVQYAFLVVLAVVVSIGTVGVPGTATITATALFAAAGLPVEAIILLSPISSIADMARTATNVVGAAAATTLVATTEGQLDKAVYNGKVEAPAAEAV